MNDYQYAWKVRKIELIILNVIFLGLGVTVYVMEKDILWAFTTWIGGVWVMGTLLSFFCKRGDRVSTLGSSFMSSMLSGSISGIFSGIGASSSSDGLESAGYIFHLTFSLIMMAWAAIKMAICAGVFAILAAFEFVAFPITTIYLFVKSRDKDEYVYNTTSGGIIDSDKMEE